MIMLKVKLDFAVCFPTHFKRDERKRERERESTSKTERESRIQLEKLENLETESKYRQVVSPKSSDMLLYCTMLYSMPCIVLCILQYNRVSAYTRRNPAIGITIVT